MFRYLYSPSHLPRLKLAFRGSRAPIVQASHISSRTTWSDEEIKLLLKFYGAGIKTPEDNNRIDGRIWRDISALLEQEGIHRLASQCKSKWRRLRIHYEKAKESGIEAEDPYHDQLKQILESSTFEEQTNSQTNDDPIFSSDSENQSSNFESSSSVSEDTHIPTEIFKQSTGSYFHEAVPVTEHDLTNSDAERNNRSFLSTDNHGRYGIPHKLVELLRSQLEFQNLMYRNIVEELQTSRREEHQLRKELLAALKQVNITKAPATKSK
ncbi:hypothetical protein K7432_008981 [Basidiobolus ranarum]|uniref:Myb-like domain-containing protein n=1 Tax=Basidiobolus ranarum TaxID=34480 RepID=A0ABR2VXS8_9FUNG